MSKPMFKLHSLTPTTRVLAGLAFAAAAVSVAGCSTPASATPPSGQAGGTSAAASTAASAEPVTLPSGPSTSTNSATGGAAPRTPAPNQGAAKGSAAASGASGVSRCHTSDLSASYTVVPGSPAAGNISYNLRLTNVSMHQCTIYGYAGMLLLDANHKPLPTNVQWDTLVPKQLLRLNPGGSAAATARFSPDVNGTGDNPSAPCQPTAHYTEVTPPDETTQLVTAINPPTSVCERGRIGLSAFVAGPTGPNQ